MTNFLKDLPYPKKPITDVEHLEIYKELLEQLMLSQLTSKEIACSLFTSEDVLNEWAVLKFNLDFGSVLDAYRTRAQALLVNKQYEEAFKGDTKMLIFLGKNYAKQSDQDKALALLQAEQVVIHDTKPLDAPITSVREEVE